MDPWKMIAPFDAFEVAACYPLTDRDGENKKRAEQAHLMTEYARAETESELRNMLGVIYTVYGHRDGQGVIAIGDFDDAASARGVAHSLAIRPGYLPLPVHDYIPDGGDKEPEERWVLEHELDG